MNKTDLLIFLLDSDFVSVADAQAGLTKKLEKLGVFRLMRNNEMIGMVIDLPTMKKIFNFLRQKNGKENKCS